VFTVFCDVFLFFFLVFCFFLFCFFLGGLGLCCCFYFVVLFKCIWVFRPHSPPRICLCSCLYVLLLLLIHTTPHPSFVFVFFGVFYYWMHFFCCFLLFWLLFLCFVLVAIRVVVFFVCFFVAPFLFGFCLGLFFFCFFFCFLFFCFFFFFFLFFLFFFCFGPPPPPFVLFGCWWDGICECFFGSYQLGVSFFFLLASFFSAWRLCRALGVIYIDLHFCHWVILALISVVSYFYFTFCCYVILLYWISNLPPIPQLTTDPPLFGCFTYLFLFFCFWIVFFFLSVFFPAPQPSAPTRKPAPPPNAQVVGFVTLSLFFCIFVFFLLFFFLLWVFPPRTHSARTPPPQLHRNRDVDCALGFSCRVGFAGGSLCLIKAFCGDGKIVLFCVLPSTPFRVPFLAILFWFWLVAPPSP